MSTSPIQAGNVYPTTNNISIVGAGWQSGANYTVSANVGSIQPVFRSSGNTIVELFNGSKEIVRLDKGGKVTWAPELDIDAAALAFSSTLVMSSELAAGIDKSVKTKIRDDIFNDIIAIAEQSGPLSAHDLTIMLQSSKIIEKLKGK